MAKKTKEGKLPKIIYTVEEEDWLVANVLLYRSIIENKKTDGATNRDKDQAWEVITKAFNAASYGQIRSTKSLREKYQKIKQSLKTRLLSHSTDAKQIGIYKKELASLSEPMRELVSVLKSSNCNLPTIVVDSDGSVITDQPTSSIHDIKLSTDDEKCFFDDVEGFDNVMIDVPEEEPEVEQQSIVIANSVSNIRGRPNSAKLRKYTNSLMRNKRRHKIESEMPNKMFKFSEERAHHLATKHEIEIEILECERERYKLECRQASLHVERAAIEYERAKLDRERSIIELERAKNQLAYEKEMQATRLAELRGHNADNSNLIITDVKQEYNN